MPNDSEPKPSKRTGVWSIDSVKQKLSGDNVPKRCSRKDVMEVSINGDETDRLIQSQYSSKSIVDTVSSNTGKLKLIKLPILNAWNGVNTALLLSQFDDISDITEGDTSWTEDTLFVDVGNILNSE